jgi:hypothetical protein
MTLLLLRPSANIILTVHTPKGGAAGTTHVLRLISLPAREDTSTAAEFALYIIYDEMLLEFCGDE